MEGSTLFRVIDAGALEASVLSEAEKRARDASIPIFGGPSALGYRGSSLRKFCASADCLVLGMAADATNQEQRRMRETGVSNLASRDRVQMKDQIMRVLLRLRDDNGEDLTSKVAPARGEARAIANPYPGNGVDVDSVASANERQEREDLIKTGAVTPLDSIASSPREGVTAPGRGRMTLMDHKVAAGMKVKLPRSRGRGKIMAKTSVRASNDNTTRREKAGGHLVEKIGHVHFTSEGQDSRSTSTEIDMDDGKSLPGARLEASEAMAHSRAPITGAASGETHDGRYDGWICHMCTLACPEDALSCPVCHARRRRRRSLPEGDKAGEQSQTGRKRRRRSDGAQEQRPMLEFEENGALGNAKRQVSRSVRVRGAQPSPECETEVESKAEVKLTGGSQLLVDDYDDSAFEERQAEADIASGATRAAEDEAVSTNPSELGDGLSMDSAISERLFQFQLTGVRWMWQLHKQGAGGIVGDEMGLGKTVQVSAFLGALHRSNVIRRALVLCPATVLAHWMTELHDWAPQLRVVILHRCAKAFNSISSSSGKLRNLVRRVLSRPDVVVVTSYEGLKSLKTQLLPHSWDYCVLDEGQRIRNPDAEVTLTCKQLRTVHRLILTGTPIQNNLRELWSLFDFAFPGRLGTLPAFEAEFAGPIRVGGYANASPMQARLAYRCALVLRDLIHPYLLRRQKKDLEDIISLPAKTEQVLFCRLTKYQRRLYAEFLESAEVKGVLRRSMRAFRAIGILRKLCNHPDLVCDVGDSIVSRLGSQVETSETSGHSESELEGKTSEIERSVYGAADRSGKLLVLQQILPLWRQQGHRVLLFSQTRQMLNIVERFVKVMDWSYGRLDGSTPVGIRQNLIDRFNNDDSVFIMLLTTRTGGVGVNLTGADRVILFDPDWNPSTDMQARERSWRVGQLRQVTVYRLITAGTIEEKIYHRQIFKTALTNRVLQDPKQKRIFSADELGDLFTLGEDDSPDGFTDTLDLFEGQGKVDAPKSRKQPGRHESDERRRGGRKGKRAQNAGRRRSERGTVVDESAEHSSALLGTATVAIDETPGGGTDPDSGTHGVDGEKSKSDDIAVLQALFDGAPLSSVFHHDVAEGCGIPLAEQKRLEEAAKRAAERAVNQLRMSRRTLRAGAAEGGFQSSWTGRNGGSSLESTPGAGTVNGGPGATGRRFGTITNPSVAVRPGTTSGHENVSSQARNYFDSEQGGLLAQQGGSSAMSSQDILRQIRMRNGSQSSPSAALFPEFQTSSDADSKDEYYSSLLQRLQDYLARAPSGVDTAALIHAFKDVRPADVAVFRQLLQSIAVCNNGEWTLRAVPA